MSDAVSGPPADDQAAAPDPLTAFADDVERRMPNLREPDALSDWSMGVVWMLDRMRNAATEGFARPAVAVPAETRDTDDAAARAVVEAARRFLISWTVGSGNTDHDAEVLESALADLSIKEARRG